MQYFSLFLLSDPELEKSVSCRSQIQTSQEILNCCSKCSKFDSKFGFLKQDRMKVSELQEASELGPWSCTVASSFTRTQAPTHAHCLPQPSPSFHTSPSEKVHLYLEHLKKYINQLVFFWPSLQTSEVISAFLIIQTQQKQDEAHSNTRAAHSWKRRQFFPWRAEHPVLCCGTPTSKLFLPSREVIKPSTISSFSFSKQKNIVAPWAPPLLLAFICFLLFLHFALNLLTDNRRESRLLRPSLLTKGVNK